MNQFGRICLLAFTCSLQGWSEPIKPPNRSEQIPGGRSQPSVTGLANKPENGEKAVKDQTNGALVWRPYQGTIQWTGEVNGRGFAEGKGTLVVFDRKGNRAAIFTGQMKDGHLIGDVTAKYPTSPDRAHYVGGYSNWAENGVGSMTYNNGKVETGTWKNGELVAINAPKADDNSLNLGTPVLRALPVNSNSESPDPETAE